MGGERRQMNAVILMRAPASGGPARELRHTLSKKQVLRSLRDHQDDIPTRLVLTSTQPFRPDDRKHVLTR